MGGEALVAVYAIVGRMLMFALFPVFGVTQGFLPIAGFNYGAGNMQRVRESINTAILYASALATLSIYRTHGISRGHYGLVPLL